MNIIHYIIQMKKIEINILSLKNKFKKNNFKIIKKIEMED